MADYILSNDGELMHYGVKGMKWGVRRYQNADGSLTAKGQKRLVKSIQKSARSRKARKDMYGKTSDMLAEELDRNTSLKGDNKNLRKLASQYKKVIDKEYDIKNERDLNDALTKVDKAWTDYAAERKRVVDSLLGQYADTPIKAVHRNTTQIADARIIAESAIDKLMKLRD